MFGSTLVQSIHGYTAPHSSEQEKRKGESRDHRSEEEPQQELKDSKGKKSAHWGRGLPTRTLLCFCLLPCCFADGVGYPCHNDVGKPCLEGQEVLRVLDATYNQPFGLPNSIPSCRDVAMANASSLGGCAADLNGLLGTSTYFLHKQEVLASRLQLCSFALASCASAVPDAACLLGLPTRCQFQYDTFLRTKEVGLPISAVLNHSLHSSCAPWVGDFNGGTLFSLPSRRLGWGLFWLSFPLLLSWDGGSSSSSVRLSRTERGKEKEVKTSALSTTDSFAAKSTCLQGMQMGWKG